MEIRIPMTLQSANSYKELKASLRQLELSVHHAQKAVESAEKNGVVVTEDSFMNYDHPWLRITTELDVREGKVSKEIGEVCDNYYEQLQNVELVINLN